MSKSDWIVWAMYMLLFMLPERYQLHVSLLRLGVPLLIGRICGVILDLWYFYYSIRVFFRILNESD